MCKPNIISKVWVITSTSVKDFNNQIDDAIRVNTIHDIKITETDRDYTATLIQYKEVF